MQIYQFFVMKMAKGLIDQIDQFLSVRWIIFLKILMMLLDDPNIILTAGHIARQIDSYV